MNRVLFGVGILILCMGSARGAPKPPLFPMQDGNYWILESSLGAQRIIRCEAGTNKLLQVTGLSERPVQFYASPKSVMLYRWDAALRKPRPTVNLRPLKKGRATFSAGKHPCDQLLMALEPVAGSIQTRAGEYSGCSALGITSTYRLIPGLCDLLTEQIYFAPGVGPVMVLGSVDRMYV